MQTRKTRLLKSKRGFRANGPILPLALRPGLVLLLSVLFVTTLGLNQTVFASSVTMTIPSSALSLDIKPNSGTVFQKSSPATITVATDSSYGYSLSIASKTNNDLVNGENKISSISSPLNELDFQNFGDNNTWGYLPNKLNGSANSDFQPGPTSEPATLDVTDTSSSDTDYNITLATKIDNTLPSGTYHNTFVLTATSNDPPYDDIMQNWSGCDDLPEETKTLNLLDTRDNKTYTVAKLKDGKCWMTKNLAIENYTLTSADSDVKSNFALPSSISSGFFDNNNPLVHIDTDGGYYNWPAATAGEGTYNKTSGDVTQSICPSNWRLPTNADVTALASAYSESYSQISAEPANFTLSGLFSDNSLYYHHERGGYWSSTSQNNNVGSDAYYLHLDTSSANSSNDIKINGYSVRCVSRGTDKTMQNVEKWADSVETDQTVSAIDTRDGKEYTVARLSDGHIWMTQNLALGDTALQNRNLTSADSDLQGSTTFNVPTSSTNGFSLGSAVNVYVDPTYGGYYTYNAATANTGTFISSGEAAGSVCPKGWRLPTQAEYTTLADQYGNNGSNLRDQAPKFVYAGDYENSSPSGQGTGGYYWSSTASSSSNVWFFYLDNSNAYVLSYDYRDLGFSVRCVSRTDDPREVGTMQTVSEWKDQVGDGETVVSEDVRDNKKYTVARLADGNLWMTENLQLGDADLKNRKLTSADSDLQGSITFDVPNSSTSGFNSNSVENVYVDPTYGGYYAYNAATAGTGNSISSYGEEAPGSICPKGWRLPTQAEYTELATQYGGNTSTGSNNLRNGTPKFVYAGYYYNSAPNNRDSYGLYWSSTAYNSSSAWHFSLRSSNAGVSYVNRYRGYSVRCLAR